MVELCAVDEHAVDVGPVERAGIGDLHRRVDPFDHRVHARDRHVVKEDVTLRIATDGQTRTIDEETLARLRTLANDEHRTFRWRGGSDRRRICAADGLE